MSSESSSSSSSPQSPLKDTPSLADIQKLFGVPLKGEDEELVKAGEKAVMALGRKLAEDKNTEELKALLQASRPFLGVLGKAKAGKLVSNLLDLSLTIDEDAQLKVDLCKESIEWSREQKRVFLRQSLEARLVRLYNDIGRHVDANALAGVLIRELKKIDDKEVLVGVQIEESKSLFALHNLSRSRASLVCAKTTANSIFMNSKMQAELDMQSGILHAAEDKDFKTAFSYFFEAFENADQAEDRPLATRAVKYMCLAKIMQNEQGAVGKLLTGKGVAKYDGPELEAMRQVGRAFDNRSLKEFLAAFETFKKQLMDDYVVKSHFTALSESMMEKELCRLIEPYLVVDLKYVADRMQLPVVRVEKKLALMLLDKSFFGCLDQSAGVVYVHQHPAEELGYHNAVKIIRALSDTVTATYVKAHKLRLMETRVKSAPVPSAEPPPPRKRRHGRRSTASTDSRSSVSSGGGRATKSASSSRSSTNPKKSGK